MSNSRAGSNAVTGAVAVGTNVRIEHYETPAVEGWADLPKAERKRRLLDQHPPERVGECHNVTCVGMHEYLPALINPHNDFSLIEDQPTQVAFGSDNTSPTSSDTSLGNRVGAIGLTDPTNSGTEWSCTELVGSLELNNYDLYELGVESDSGTLFNHALLPTPLTPKSSNDEVIVTITWAFSAP